MYDTAFLGNALFFGLALMWQVGVFADLFSGDSGSEPEPVEETDPTDEGPTIDLNDFEETIRGAEENDNLTASTDSTNAAFGLGEGDDTATGGDGDDYAFGGPGNDFLYGENGNDTLAGGVGNDQLVGGSGDDELWGQSGDDVLSGNNGNDHLMGGSGADWLNGGQGQDTLEGGVGDDLLNLTNGDTGTGNSGNDRFLYFEPAMTTEGVAKITDFDVKTDTLEIQYQNRSSDPAIDERPNVTIEYDSENDLTLVKLDDVTSVEISGQSAITEKDIVLTLDI